MRATECRDLTWAEIQARLVGLRLRALLAWRLRGPGTTRAVAARCEFPLLTFRPRTTELLQMGYLECCGREDGEGVYQALSEAEARRRYDERGKPEQMALGLREAE